MLAPGKFAGLALLLLSSTLAIGQSMVTLTSPPYSAHGDGVTNDGPALQRALASGNSVYVPAGTFLIDNSAGPLTISNFSATLQVNPLAVFACSTPTRACLVFNGGSNPNFQNLHVTYMTIPTDDCRAGQGLCVTLLFDGATNPVIQGTTVENGWAIAVSVNNTINAKVQNTVIHHSTRDALYLQDNQNISVTGLIVSDPGDDCLGFHVTLSNGGRDGGNASNINCSSIRGGGIAFAGGSNITVSDFVISGTSAQGIYVVSDPSTYRLPNNISVSHGVIRGVGTVADAVSRVGTQHGIQFYTAGGSNIGTLQFNDIIIDSVNGYGITGLNANSASFTNVHVSNAGLDGATSNGSCAQFVYNGAVTLSNFTARGCYRTGVMAVENGNVTLSTATVTDAWKKGALESGAKAFDIVLNTYINVTNVSIVDDANAATGYTFNENANGSGSVNGIFSEILSGALKLVHGSPAVTFHP